MTELWLISAPGDKTCQQTWENMNNVTSKQNNLSSNWKFHIPDLKVKRSFTNTFFLQPSNRVSFECIVIPRTGDIVFSLFVCLSVCPRRFVWHFVRLPSPRLLNAQERNLYHMKALDEQHVMAPSVFRYRQYLRQKWHLKQAILRFLYFLCA